MKKILFIAIALIAMQTSFAQTQESTPGFSKGDTFVTGSFKYSDATKDFNLSASANTFVTKSISVGAGYTRTQLGDVKTNDATVNVRNYYSAAKQFSVFAELRGAKNLDGNANVNIAINPGLNYFIAKNFSLETKLGLLSYNTDGGDYELGTDLTNIQLGVNYRF
jgi:hypothetical protein